MTVLEEVVNTGDDDPVVLLAEGLLGCLCDLLPSTRRGDVCSCCFYPGVNAPADNCCDCGDGQGQAFVSVARVYRSAARFPEPESFRDPSSCATGGWTAVFTLGVYRCAATMDDDGNPPTCAQIRDDALALASDASALRQAVACCFPDLIEELGGGQFLIGEYVTVGPDGGCMGGRITITVSFVDCCPDDG